MVTCKGKKEEILEAALRCISEERNITYGDSTLSFKAVADLWNAYILTMQKSKPALEPSDCAILMTLLKIARFLSSPTHEDNCIDAAGYIAIAAELAVVEST